ncbi:MAG TPA: PQQ-binding-like beta-propeller repeat protein, partial [Candidatus Polarisedimenticolaceae bacterium]|nr:PQQ-binding-like beta-propeller repeat protein [Candidatus Polarisedimenticolaceae bacterium]
GTDAGWPQWGGPRGDFTVGTVGLADSWPPAGPPRLWRRDLGRGYSAIAARHGRLYTMYRDGLHDVVVALDAGTGETSWEHRYPGRVHPGNVTQFGVGPNAMPLALDDRVVTLGYGGMLNCLDAATGEPLWRHDLVADYDGAVPEFGYSASPVLLDGKVIVLVGGERQGVIALDPADGAVAWAGPPSSVSYATPIGIELDGQRQIVYFTADEVVGLDANDGAKLWSHPCVNQYRNNATPPQWDPRSALLWVATQLDGGGRALRLRRTEAGTAVEEAWFNDEIKIHFWNSVRVGDHVYASIGGQVTLLAAVELATGAIKWRERGYSKINAIYVGDRLIFLDEKGLLGMARVSPEGFDQLAETRISAGKTWTVPTLAGTTLFVRDDHSIQAFDLGPGRPAG